MDKKKVCFVIMGFGKKTDYNTGRTIDLDLTYNQIIKPVIEEIGLTCIRGDEIQDSGTIDVEMYSLLLKSDLVIADISTLNPNALYELGVRHSIKQYSTVIMMEKQSKIPFDLDHTRVFKYEHLGDEISRVEVGRCKKMLFELLCSIIYECKVDSPLYTYIKELSPPVISNNQFNTIVDEMITKEDSLYKLSESAKTLMDSRSFKAAGEKWEKASELFEAEDYFVQQHAFCIYKSQFPSKEKALHQASIIISKLNPKTSGDPETLGIAGAIYKNYFEVNKDVEFLDDAIFFYKRGFNIRNDYYNGENYALCIDIKKNLILQSDEKIYLKVEAKKVRKSIILQLENEIQKENFPTRTDKKWIYATIAHCYYATDQIEEYEKYNKLFFEEKPKEWEKETFEKSRKELDGLNKEGE